MIARRAALALTAILVLPVACSSSNRDASSTAATSAGDDLDCRRSAAVCWGDQRCDGATGYCREAAFDPTLDYDVQLYDLGLDFDSAAATYDARLKIYLLATKDGTREITLSTTPHPPAATSAADGGASDAGSSTDGGAPSDATYTVHAVTDGVGQDLAFTEDRVAGTLKVILPRALAADEGTVLTIRYAGVANPIADPKDPLYATGLIYRPALDGVPTLQTYSWPNRTRRWLPSHDHPSDTARFISRVSVDIPGATILANGNPAPASTEGARTSQTFVLRQPVPVYAFFVGARPYVAKALGATDGVPATAYMYARDIALADGWSTSVLGAQRFLDDKLGPNPFERYGIVELPDPNGGMEHATIVSANDKNVEAADHERDIVIHELTHHYFGDNAHVARWEDFWLTESIATYLTAQITGAEDGGTAYADYIAARKKVVLGRNSGLFNDGPMKPDDPTDLTPVEGSTNAFLDAPYYKGPLVWHMLKQTMDDATFWRFMRTFYERSRFAKYDTALFRQVLDEVTGKDNGQFVKEWVLQAGWPTVKPTFAYDATSKKVTLKVDQTQDVTKFGTYTFDGALTLKFALDDADPSTPSCTADVTFTGGAVSATVVATCPYAPTTVTLANAPDLLVAIAN